MHPVKTATIITILLFLVAATTGAEKPAPFARAENQLAIDTGASLEKVPPAPIGPGSRAVDRLADHLVRRG